MAQDGGVAGRDRVKSERQAIAPSLALGLGSATRIYLSSLHMRQDNVPDGGIPSVGLEGFFFNNNDPLRTAPRVDRENYYGLAGDYEKVDADMATAKIEHDLAGGAKLTNVSRYGKSKMDRVMTGINAVNNGVTLAKPTPLPQAEWSINRSRQSLLQKNEILANQTNLLTEFATGGVKHTVSGGIEFMSEKQSTPGRAGLGTLANRTVGVVPANLYQPNPNDVIYNYNPQKNGAYTEGKTTTAALYVFDTLKLSEQWQVNGGVRVEHDNTKSDLATLTNGVLVPAALEKSDTLVSWKAGALYKPADNASVYLAFANSQTPPGSSNFALSATTGNINGPAMDPQQTRNIELGTKWDVLAKQLALTAALYRTENTNVTSLLDSATNTYSQLGKRRVEGLELGMVGQITRAWNKLTATVWSSYNVDKAWTVGGGARYTSEQKRVVDPSLAAALQNNLPGIPAYFVADAMLSYKASKNVTVQLNLYNLFDKFYVNTLNNSGARATLGTERSAALSASLAF